MLSFSCLRGAKTGREGEDNCVYRRLLFFTRTTKARGKKHKDNNFVPLSLCLKGKGKDDEDL